MNNIWYTNQNQLCKLLSKKSFYIILAYKCIMSVIFPAYMDLNMWKTNILSILLYDIGFWCVMYYVLYSDSIYDIWKMKIMGEIVRSDAIRISVRIQYYSNPCRESVVCYWPANRSTNHLELIKQYTIKTEPTPHLEIIYVLSSHYQPKYLEFRHVLFYIVQ